MRCFLLRANQKKKKKTKKHAAFGLFPGWSMKLSAFASDLFATNLLGPSVPFRSSSSPSAAGGTARDAKRLVHTYALREAI